jgi:hypothetical protein
MQVARHLSLLPILAMLLGAACPGPQYAAAQGEQASADEDASVQIGTIFDQPIHMSMIEPPANAVERMRTSMDARSFDAWMLQQRTRILTQYIFERLANAYKQENGITVNEDEISQFIAREKQAYDDVIRDYEKRIEDLRAQAEEITARGGTVSDEHMREIVLYQKKIENMERKNVDNLVISDKQRQLYEDIRHQRVSRALRAWKFNRMIHEQFGGRVVVQDLTYRPFEAHEAWLQIQEQLGNFSITDDQLRDAFWNVYAEIPENPMEPFEGMWDRLRWYGEGMP